MPGLSPSVSHWHHLLLTIFSRGIVSCGVGAKGAVARCCCLWPSSALPSLLMVGAQKSTDFTASSRAQRGALEALSNAQLRGQSSMEAKVCLAPELRDGGWWENQVGREGRRRAQSTGIPKYPGAADPLVTATPKPLARS